MIPAIDIAHSKAFEHRAMNTLFRIRLPGSPGPAAVAPAIGACFVELDRLEQLLSRYVEDSDISRLNALADGESLFIHEDTHAILLKALSLHSLTGGLFDVTLGSQTLRHQFRTEQEPAPPVTNAGFVIDPDRPRATRIGTARTLDLGGIGKGFALDRMALILDDHGIRDALLQAGASTILARGMHPWRISMESDAARLEVLLEAAALSASGSGIQGTHVLLPDGTIPAHYCWPNVRVLAATATLADALSTACLLMTEDELREFASRTPDVQQVWIPHNGTPLALIAQEEK